MLLVGRGKLFSDDIRRILQEKDPQQADFSAPPEGLYLTAVKYQDLF